MFLFVSSVLCVLNTRPQLYFTLTHRPKLKQYELLHKATAVLASALTVHCAPARVLCGQLIKLQETTLFHPLQDVASGVRELGNSVLGFASTTAKQTRSAVAQEIHIFPDTFHLSSWLLLPGAKLKKLILKIA
jgi:hypothetical protein